MELRCIVYAMNLTITIVKFIKELFIIYKKSVVEHLNFIFLWITAVYRKQKCILFSKKIIYHFIKYNNNQSKIYCLYYRIHF